MSPFDDANMGVGIESAKSGLQKNAKYFSDSISKSFYIFKVNNLTFIQFFMNEFLYDEAPEQFTLNATVEGYLHTTAKWGKFLAIVGFIGIALMLVMGFFFGSVISKFMTVSNPEAAAISGPMSMFMSGFYLLFALLYFFPVLYLYKFSSKMQDGLRAQSAALVEESFKNLKSLFKFLGVLTAVILGFYVLILVFGIGAASLSGIF
ncbi:MAG: hypothetical protein ACO1OQ_15395 [Rufibacter sp.]